MTIVLQEAVCCQQYVLHLDGQGPDRRKASIDLYRAAIVPKKQKHRAVIRQGVYKHFAGA
jgi:hypothetical protein